MDKSMPDKDLPYDYEPVQPGYWRQRQALSARQIARRLIIFMMGGFCLFFHLLLPD